MALRGNTVNGNEYQHSNVGFDLSLDGGDGAGASFTVKTFKKIAYKFTAKKKATNNAEGDIDGYTMDKLESSGSISMRLSEWKALKKWLRDQTTEKGILQVEFLVTVTYGHKLDDLMTDSFTMMFDEEPRDSQDNQDVLVVDIPIFCYKPQLHDGNPVIYSADE